MRNLEIRKSDKAEEVQTEADFVKEQAMQQYEKYRRVEPSERGTAMFDEMLRLKRENMRARLILQVHDELIVEAQEDAAEQAARILTEEMEGAVSLTVPMVAEASVGKTWYDAKG